MDDECCYALPKPSEKLEPAPTPVSHEFHVSGQKFVSRCYLFLHLGLTYDQPEEASAETR